MPPSHFKRSWSRFVSALVLVDEHRGQRVAVIVARQPRSGGRWPQIGQVLAVRQRPSAEPGNEPELPNASSGPSGRRARERRRKRTNSGLKYGCAIRQPEATKEHRHDIAASGLRLGIQTSPECWECCYSHRRNVLQGSSDHDWTPVTGSRWNNSDRKGEQGYSAPIPRVFSITPSPNLIGHGARRQALRKAWGKEPASVW